MKISAKQDGSDESFTKKEIKLIDGIIAKTLKSKKLVSEEEILLTLNQVVKKLE